MSGEGGDTGGGSGFDSSGNSTGASDSGGSSKGGMGAGETGAANKGGGDSFAPTGDTANYSDGGGGGYTDPTSGYTPSGDPSGTGFPSEITTGMSDPGGAQWGAPSINDFIPSGTDGGFNLGGSGPVGGDSGLPGAGGGANTPMAFDTYSTSGVNVPAAADSAVAAAPAANNAAAFAAPSGVSGTPQLDSLVAAPDVSGSTTDPGQNANSVFDSLRGAETAATNESAMAFTPTEFPVGSSSTTLAAATPSASGGGSGGGNSQTTGMFPSIGTGNMGALAAGAGMINNLINGNKPLANASNLTGNATSANTVATQQNEAGTALQQYVATGKLPSGYEDQVQQAAQSAKQTIISNYANRGQPTDPTRNSMLAQELAQVDARLPAMREQIAGELAKTGSGMVSAGLTASGISSGIYQTLANLENSQNQQRGAAIANFASALNGGTRSKAA